MSDKNQLYNLIEMNDKNAIFAEAEKISISLFPNQDMAILKKIFHDIVSLFEGNFEGYQKCNTEYHDLSHTLDVFLATVRLLDGIILNKIKIPFSAYSLCLSCALFHDVGYIQEKEDKTGTGAKYTINHISRSIEFMNSYCRANKIFTEDFDNIRDIINCTGLSINPKQINFQNQEIRLLGMCLGTSDLLGQMADRTYLEKLLFLYQEFIEGNIGTYEDEHDLLTNTVSFYNVTQKRFKNELEHTNKHMLTHFIDRWNIDEDLYQKAIDNNFTFLKSIIKKGISQYQNDLKRAGLVKKYKQLYQSLT